MPDFILRLLMDIPFKIRPSGMELPTEQPVKEVAHEIAKQVSIDVNDEDPTAVAVKTDDGKEIYKALIKPD